MTPWVIQWEKQFAQMPGAIAVINDRGHKFTYGDLRARAQSLEHRYNALGLRAGHKLLVNFEKHQSLDDIVVSMWACGLREACFAPWWKGFKKHDAKDWGLQNHYAPHLKVDPEVGDGRVFHEENSTAHQMSIAWPSRVLEGAVGPNSLVQWNWLRHEDLVHAIHHFKAATHIQANDRLAWMDPGLGSLGWLAVFCALGIGATVVQVPILARRNTEFFKSWMAMQHFDWIVPSSDWCAYTSGPQTVPSKGVISAWGQATPYVRAQWGSLCRWIDIWSPPACGFWWGSFEWSGSDEDPCLPDAQDGPDWHFENGVLSVGSGADNRPLGRGVEDAGGTHTGVRLSLCGLEDENKRNAWHAAFLELRQYPRIGDIRSIQIDDHHWIGVQPRSHDESPQHIMEDVKTRLVDIMGLDYSRKTHLVIANEYAPTDEVGALDIAAAKSIVGR